MSSITNTPRRRNTETNELPWQNWELAGALLVVALVLAVLIAGGWHMTHHIAESALKLSELDAAPAAPQPAAAGKEDVSRSRRTRTPYETCFESIQLCQALGPAAPTDPCGVDCLQGNCYDGRGNWKMMGPVDFQQYGQGEYIGHAR